MSDKVYTIKQHGDALEKEAANFIQEKFQYYEKVWQIFVGNTGNAEKSTIPNYPIEEEKKRTEFAENSYTVLESSFLIYRILESGIFNNRIDSFNQYLEFNKSFITFFALLGRMRDTVVKVSETLKYNNKSFEESIHNFYERRNVIIHGKKIPLVFDELGLIQIPVIRTSLTKGKAWDDKNIIWDEAKEINKVYVEETLPTIFYDLLNLINNEYATFYNLINVKLKKHDAKLEFKYDIGGVKQIETKLEFSEENLNKFQASAITISFKSSASSESHNFYKKPNFLNKD